MSEYREIQGAAVQSLASNTGTIEGQIWYDNVNGVFKLQSVTTSASWASGGTLPAVRSDAGQAGTQTAMVLAGGRNPANTTNTTFTYDGSTWSPVNNLGTARSLATMFGTQTAAVLASSSASGAPFTSTTATEEWDGTNWTAGGAMNTSRYGSFAGGTLTQGVIAGGSGPSVYFDDTEEYDGTSWTSVTNMPADQGNGTSGADSQLDMSCVGGGPGTQTTHTIYNGTTWTAGNSLTGDGRRGNRGAMPSSSSPGFVAAGETATVNPITITEEYDGTSFSSSTAIPTATRDAANGTAGTGTAGLFSGGTAPSQSPSTTNKVFEWTGSGIPVTQTITTT